MSCNSDDSGSTRWRYTGNQVGDLNYTGWYNFVSGGPAGSSLSAGTTVPVTYLNTLSRRPWLADNAVFNDVLLDACYPVINLQWFAEITIKPDVTFRVSNRSFYVQDKDGVPRYYDARAEKAPSINVTVGEWLAANYEVSDLSITLNNRDGFYNQYLPQGSDYVQWSGGSVIVKVGFGEKFENYFTLFEGQITVKQGLSTTRDSIEIRAYDKLDLDEVPLPINVFSSDLYPDVMEEAIGKGIPLVYGDWTENVPEWGSVEAYCTNALDPDAETYEYKISDIELESIDSIWLHRGKFKEGEPEGPRQFDLSTLTLDPTNGEFQIPIGEQVFETDFVLYDTQQCGAGSSTNLIVAKDTTVSFLNKSVQPGDRVLRTKDGAIATISAVGNTTLTLTGGITFEAEDDFNILTDKYKYIKGDRISVVCKGKPLNLISKTRLIDAVPTMTAPSGISISFDKTYWICDDGTQKVYNLSFKGEIIQEIAYSNIHSSITNLSGISAASDNYIWVSDPNTSTLYRYNYIDEGLGRAIPTSDITGIGVSLGHLAGVVVTSDNELWIVDRSTSTFYKVDAFSTPVPFTIASFDKSAFDNAATEITSVDYDDDLDQVLCVDRITNKFYRLSDSSGTLVSSVSLTSVDSDINFPVGVSYAPDGSLFFVDRGLLTVYNYVDNSYASYNPCYIARDILQKSGAHTHDDYDLSWNNTAVQLSGYKCRAVIKDKTNAVTYINQLLGQFNITFFQKFGKLALFWIHFSNFTTGNRLVKEMDIKQGTFKPMKEVNQYFNTASADYDYRPFQGKALKSDTYVSAAGIEFAGREVNKNLPLNNVYKRTDLDKLMPLYVRLSVPEPEFIEVTLGFRLIRAQMQSFVNFTFDDSDNVLGLGSGRRFTNVPCMIRKIVYDLDAMTVGLKLWSLGNTAFDGYTPPGNSVGGQNDKITLTTLGRMGRISPVGDIVSHTTNTITLQTINGQDAETRTHGDAGLAWKPGYAVSIVDGGVVRTVLQTLTIQSVSGNVITFNEDITASASPTVRNDSGLIASGHYLQYADYSDLTQEQKDIFASFTRPTTSYPTSKAKEIEEQRGGLHSFDDSGLPYVNYPIDYIPIE